MSAYKFVNHLWDEAKAASLDAVGRLVYRSNLLGSDRRITNTGEGNTSAKLSEKDPLSGQPVKVLWVKGSGGDLRTSTRESFPRSAAALCRAFRQGPEGSGRGRHGGHVQSHHVQSQPTSVLLHSL